MLKDYYELAKPGLVYGNLITVIAGFLMGTPAVDLLVLLGAVFGMAFVMGSGCVFNNVIDRRIDAAMLRTKARAVAAGRVSKSAAILYGACLGIAGFVILFFGANSIAAAAALIGWLAYVVLYSWWAKLRTVHAAELGSISGAMPPVVGYAAAAGGFGLTAHFYLGAALLFAILILWQMPHFYAIAIYRLDDYRAGGVPVLPVRKGIAATKRIMVGYIVAFIVVAPLLATFGYAGPIYSAVALALGFAWMGLSVRGFYTDDDRRWARSMFFCSVIVMTVLFGVLAVGSLY